MKGIFLRLKEVLLNIHGLPFWIKLAAGGACLVIIHTRRQYRVFKNCGVDAFLQNYGIEFEMGHNGYLKLGAILRNHGYKTVGFCSGGSRRIASIDHNLIQVSEHVEILIVPNGYQGSY